MSPNLIPTLAVCGLSVLLVPGCKNKEQQKEIDQLNTEIERITEEHDDTVNGLEEKIREHEETADKSQEENATKLDESSKQVSDLKSELDNAKQEIDKLKAEIVSLTPQNASEPGHAEFDPSKQTAFTDAMATITGDTTSGIGFVVEDGGKHYLYTTAATLTGNSRLAVAAATGVKFTKFGNLETAEGCNFVRLELLEAAEVPALKLAPSAATASPETKLCALGMTPTTGSVSGEMLTAFGQGNENIDLDPNAIANRIGGPVIDTATGKVMAIITSTSVVVEDLWATPTPSESPQVAASRINRDLTWQPYPIAAFLANSKRIHDFDRYTKLVNAFAAMTPTPDGLGFTNQLGDNQTIRSVLTELKAVPVVVEAATLDAQMAAKKTRLGESDLKRRITSMFSSVASQSKANAATFDPAKFSTFHQKTAERSLAWRKEAMEKLESTASGLAELELKPPTEKPLRDDNEQQGRRRR